MYNFLATIALVLGAYFLGNVSTAMTIARFKGVNLRAQGSGNPGTMNVIRTFGKLAGGITLLLDVIKGALPCVVGWWLLGTPMSFSGNRIGLYIGGFSVIVGHIYPVTMGFKGGRGIASTLGICLVASPILAPITFAIGTLFIIITHIGAPTSFIIIGPPLLLEMTRTDDLTSRILIMALFALTLYAHRSNIFRLFSNTDKPVVIFRKK